MTRETRTQRKWPPPTLPGFQIGRGAWSAGYMDTPLWRQWFLCLGPFSAWFISWRYWEIIFDRREAPAVDAAGERKL